LIVLDTGSEDDTVRLAKQAGALVFEEPWPDSFAKARNRARELTHGEWVMHLDGHDHLPDRSLQGFIALKPELDSLTEFDAITTPMCIVDANREPLLSWPRERICRRHLEWVGDAHTVIGPKAPTWRDLPVYTAQRTGGKPKRALEVLRKQYEAGDHSRRTVFYLARETFWAQQYAEAIPLYNAWLAMLPVAWEKYSGLLDLAACYEQTGDLEAATATKFRAVDLIPTRAEAWAALGITAERQGRTAAALRYAENCAQAQRPKDGFVVERWYGDYPSQWVSRLREMLAGR
jgi:tetratricopeptide (TPR) repeat protein